MLSGVTNADSIPVLEQLMRFASARHRLIAHNIANLSTPGYRAVDLSVDAFRERLAEAVDRRREDGGTGDLRLEEPFDGPVDDPSEVVLANRNLLFHDRNDRDLERTMQDLVENFMTVRMAAQFMRSRFDLINTAIRERI